MAEAIVGDGRDRLRAFIEPGPGGGWNWIVRYFPRHYGLDDWEIGLLGDVMLNMGGKQLARGWTVWSEALAVEEAQVCMSTLDVRKKLREIEAQ